MTPRIGGAPLAARLTICKPLTRRGKQVFPACGVPATGRSLGLPVCEEHPLTNMRLRAATLVAALLSCGPAIGGMEKGAEDAIDAAPRSAPILAQAATPDTPRPLPRPPRIRYEDEWLAALPAAGGGAPWRCLTEALYFEARGEEPQGQFAVAEVILNRVDSRRFPGSVCSVVNQGTGRKWQCQFTYTCDGIPETVRDRGSWARMGKIARLALDGAPRELTHGALFYHTRAVAPSWSRVFFRTTTIGAHHFYSPGTRLASN